jgi:hypothetical protein
LSLKKKENIHSWNISNIKLHHQSIYQTSNHVICSPTFFYSLNF